LEVNGKKIPLPPKAEAVVQAMDSRGWKYGVRTSAQGELTWVDFYKNEDCISARLDELGDNWLLETMVKYDSEIRKATIDAAFKAMCAILK